MGGEGICVHKINHHQEKLKLLAKSWGLNYSALLKEDGYPIALTSNKPITVVTKMMHDRYGHGMLHTILISLVYTCTPAILH